jgi:hypothetical protein
MPLMKKAGVPLTPLGDAAHEIAARLVSEQARLKRIAHGCFGKLELRADQENRGDARLALVFELGIVHFPKQPRCAGELRAFGGDLGMRVYFGQWEMTENKPQAPTKRQLNVINDGMCPRASARV